nr:MAG TPA_asm: hypothetical protein [Caudoviricetes sp.]
MKILIGGSPLHTLEYRTDQEPRNRGQRRGAALPPTRTPA